MDKQRGPLLLKALKFTVADGPSLSIPVGKPVTAILRPISAQREYIRPTDVSYLTEWRNRFVTSFLTEFNATNEQTLRWLSSIVGPNDKKILFMLDDIDGNTFGYMGLDYIDWNRNYGEADAIVRGGRAAPGVMTLALKTLMGWAHTQLGLRTLGVRVRSDNTALNFYEKMGFVEHSRVALKKIVEGDCIRWTEDPSAKDGGISLVHMLYEA